MPTVVRVQYTLPDAQFLNAFEPRARCGLCREVPAWIR